MLSARHGSYVAVVSGGTESVGERMTNFKLKRQQWGVSVVLEASAWRLVIEARLLRAGEVELAEGFLDKRVE